jgi:NAD(P)-dependent dehydrogenase (short-subunit alcohol dehydrogenase family)
MDLSGRVALVTGGAGHIGRAICDALAESGANIVVLDIDADACRLEQARLAETFDVKAESIPMDLGDDEAIRVVPSSVEEMFGRLDVIVNAAGLVGTSDLKGWSVPFEDQGVEAWRLAQDINLLAPFALTQACTPLLRKSGAASVVNVSSIYGVVGPDPDIYSDPIVPPPAAYAASKGGLIQLTRWLATTLAPVIRVNSITPGGISRDHPAEFARQYEAKTPLGRMGIEEDIKGAAAYLASDLSNYVTGHNLVVDGGLTAW